MATLRVRMGIANRRIISLSGRLASGWSGHFAHALAARAINIESGFASRNARGHWTAEFDVSLGHGAAEPARLDVRSLIAAPAMRSNWPDLRLTACSLTRPVGEPQVIAVVEGRDQPGFLAQLLSQFACFSLFPVEMRIDTMRGHVRDRFHLRSVAGSAPPEETLAIIRRSMDGFLRA